MNISVPLLEARRKTLRTCLVMSVLALAVASMFCLGDVRAIASAFSYPLDQAYVLAKLQPPPLMVSGDYALPFRVHLCLALFFGFFLASPFLFL